MCFLCADRLPNHLLRNSGKFEFEIVPDRIFRLTKGSCRLLVVIQRLLVITIHSEGGAASKKNKEKKPKTLNMRTSREKPSNVPVLAAIPFVDNGSCYGSVSAEGSPQVHDMFASHVGSVVSISFPHCTVGQKRQTVICK